MKWKLVVLGGLAWYVGTFLVGLATVPIIHQGIQVATYQSISDFFRPELVKEPDPAALMPYWVATGLVSSFLLALLFSLVRPAIPGPGWKRGLLFGLFLTLGSIAIFLIYSGVLNLPPRVWFWWIVDDLIRYCVGGVAMGFVAGKVAPTP